MFFIYLFACSIKYYNAEARVNTLSTGGGEGEFYVVSNLYCGPMFFPRIKRDEWIQVNTAITRCETHQNKKGLPVVKCDNIAEADTLGLSVTNLSSFTIENSYTLCPYYSAEGQSEKVQEAESEESLPLITSSPYD